MLFLNKDDIAKSINLNGMMDQIEEAYRIFGSGEFYMPPRPTVTYGNQTLIYMPCFTERSLGTKMLTIFPAEKVYELAEAGYCSIDDVFLQDRVCGVENYISATLSKIVGDDTVKPLTTLVRVCFDDVSIQKNATDVPNIIGVYPSSCIFLIDVPDDEVLVTPLADFLDLCGELEDAFDVEEEQIIYKRMGRILKQASESNIEQYSDCIGFISELRMENLKAYYILDETWNVSSQSKKLENLFEQMGMKSFSFN